MDNQDKYIVGVRDKYICYFKNRMLHREVGPAIFLIEDKLKYFDLDDKDLYKHEHTQALPPNGKSWEIMMEFMLKYAIENIPGYYLEGQEYNKEIWESLIKKKKLQEELSKDLPQTEEKIKKPKI